MGIERTYALEILLMLPQKQVAHQTGKKIREYQLYTLPLTCREHNIQPNQSRPLNPLNNSMISMNAYPWAQCKLA